MQVDTDVIALVESLASRYSRRYGVDWDDLQQNVYVALLQADEPQFRSDGYGHPLGALVRTVIRRQAVQMLRDRLGPPKVEVYLTDWSSDAMHPAEERVLEKVETRADVERLLATLTANELEVVQLVYEGYNVREAADVLGIEYQAAYKRWTRAKSRIVEAAPSVDLPGA